MALPEDDRRALRTRLAPAGGAAADVVAEAVDDGEELREILVDAQGDVVAFTDRRALFVADGSAAAVIVGYDEVEVRKRDAGLAIDALIEGGRLVLDVARGTFARLAVVGAGAPPGRASWLPLRAPAPRPEPGPMPTPSWAAEHAPGSGDVPVSPSSVPPPPPPSSTPAPAPPPAPGVPGFAAPRPPALAAMPPPMPRPVAPPPGLPPAGWHPDPSRRHWWRWWDGRDWTDHVADGGAPSIDPLPPR